MVQQVVRQPSLWAAYGIALASLLAGASCVHWLYKPDLVRV